MHQQDATHPACLVDRANNALHPHSTLRLPPCGILAATRIHLFTIACVVTSESITSLKRSSTGVTFCFPGYLDVPHFFMGMRPTLYHFYAGTSFRTGPYYLLFFFFFMHLVYLPSLQGTECLFGKFSFVFYLLTTAKGREVGGGLSTGTRAKRDHASLVGLGGN